MQSCERHILSVDLFIDSQRQKARTRIISNRKNRFSILSGSNLNVSSKLSLQRNKDEKIYNQKRTVNCKEYFPTKYYINKKGSKERSISKLGERSQVSQRGGGITCSLQKPRSSSKSNRIHTIDYVQEQLKKDSPDIHKKAKNENITLLLKDLTNRKINCFDGVKKSIKKKTIINNIEVVGYSKQAKNINKNRNQDNSVQNRKIAKSKTEINDQDGQHSPFKEDDRKDLDKGVIQQRERDYLLSERVVKGEISVKKIDFKRNRGKKSLAIESCRDNKTLEIKRIQIMKMDEPVNIEQSYNREKQKEHKDNHEECEFNKYLDFIRMQNSPDKKKQERKSSQAEKPFHKKLRISNQSNKKVQGKENNQEKDDNCKTIREEVSKKQSLNLFKSKQLDCSSIKDINQSSFLSQNGKKQIIATKDLFEMEKVIQPHQIAQGSYYDLNKFVLQKKKKRKKDSKMSWIYRSDLKVFPERFFG